MELEDKVAIITGGGRGLGRAIALHFAQEGAHVAVAARTEPEIEAADDGIRALDRRALAIPCDVSNASHVRRMVEATIAEFGTIDILVGQLP